VRPGLSAWFSSYELSYAGGGGLFFDSNGRDINLSECSDKLFSTSYIFYPASIQAQSVSISLPINDKVLNTSINHISYGTFKGYDENAVENGNYTSSDTWLKLGYNQPIKNFATRVGFSNQIYISKLENYISTSIYSSIGFIWKISKYKLDIAGAINDVVLYKNNLMGNINSMNFNIGICKELTYLPMKISIDCRLNNIFIPVDYYMSGIFKISEIFKFNIGTSSRKFNQNTRQSLSQTIFGSTGLGVVYNNENIIINYGLYFYGTGGFCNGLDLTISF
jgi:hypothetical protein